MTITSIFGYPGAFAFAFTSTLAIAAIHAHPITFSHRPLSPWDRLAESPFSTKAGGGFARMSRPPAKHPVQALCDSRPAVLAM